MPPHIVGQDQAPSSAITIRSRVIMTPQKTEQGEFIVIQLMFGPVGMMVPVDRKKAGELADVLRDFHKYGVRKEDEQHEFESADDVD